MHKHTDCPIVKFVEEYLHKLNNELEILVGYAQLSTDAKVSKVGKQIVEEVILFKKKLYKLIHGGATINKSDS